jgi:hypothetical protein
VDGFHASATPPLAVSAVAAPAIAQLRLGLVDQGDEAGPLTSHHAHTSTNNPCPT